jgi:hypothetical protein
VRHLAAVGLAVSCPTSVLAQAVSSDEPPAAIQTQATSALLFDDNLFWESEGIADFFIRITPAVIAQHRSATLTVLSSYTFDAERYIQQHAVSTPMARQRAHVSATGKPNGTTTWLVEGAFATTTTPVDFNLSTGLAPGRYHARSWDSRAEFTRALSQKTALRAEYALAVQVVPDFADIDTNGIDVAVERRISEQDSVSFRGLFERFGFDPGATIYSEAGLVGYARQLAPHVSASVEAGPRYTLGSFQPEVVAKLTLEGARTRLLVDYTATQTTAVGVFRTIDVQRYQARVTHRLSQRAEAGVRGTVFLNQLGSQTSRVTRIAAEVQGPITGRVLYAIGYSTDLLRGDLYRGPAYDQAFTRNVVSVGLALIPWRTR